MKSEASEEELLKGLANGDRTAVEIIYKNNFNVVLAMVTGNNGSYDDAKDIFQEAMLVLFEKSKETGFQLSSQIRTFLYAVCRRLWLKRLNRQERFYVLSDVEVEDENVFSAVDMEELTQKEAVFTMMESAMNKLGEPCKSLLVAYYIHKKGMSELVETFGYTNTDNAKTQKYKCLMRLKKLFFAQYKTRK